MRTRRHHRFDYEGVRSSGGRDRTCALAGNNRASSQLDHAGFGQAEAAGLEPASGGGRLRVSNALPFQLGHASWRRKERDSNPQGPQPHPFSGGDTAPMAVLPRSGPGRRRTCTFPVKSRELCRCVELRSRGDDVTGRGRTCDAPRFKRALYRLSYGHVIRSMFIATRCQPRSTTVA